MRRSTERILTTHTGSLPRPDDLVPMLYAKESGELRDEAAFEARVQTAVAEIVRQQSAAGIDVINDGEVSKASYTTYVRNRLSGFGGVAQQRAVALSDLAEVGMEPPFTRPTVPVCNGTIAYVNRHDLDRDIANLKHAAAAAGAQELFMTAASPGVVALFFENRYYPTQEAYVMAVAEAMKTEYEAISAAGIILQLDCPDFGVEWRALYPNHTLEQFRKNAAMRMEALNHALANVPADRARMHVCWGNDEAPHHHDLPLRDFIDILLRARPAGLVLEAANPRHEHEWRLFEEVKLPRDKVMIPGVLDSTTNFVEHPELVARRLCRWAGVVGRENVIAGTDCGFATLANYNSVHPKVTWLKLAAMAEGARIASKQLW